MVQRVSNYDLYGEKLLHDEYFLLILKTDKNVVQNLHSTFRIYTEMQRKKNIRRKFHKVLLYIFWVLSTVVIKINCDEARMLEKACLAAIYTLFFVLFCQLKEAFWVIRCSFMEVISAPIKINITKRNLAAFGAQFRYWKLHAAKSAVKIIKFRLIDFWNKNNIF